jgi:hypothetical protein
VSRHNSAFLGKRQLKMPKQVSNTDLESIVWGRQGFKLGLALGPISLLSNRDRSLLEDLIYDPGINGIAFPSSQ